MLNDVSADIIIQQHRLMQLLNVDKVYVPEEDHLPKLNVEIKTDSMVVYGNLNVQLLEQAVTVEDANINQEQMKLSPGLKFGYFNQSIDLHKGFQGWVVGITVPLWFWSYSGNIQSARIQKEMVANSYEHEVKRTRLEFMSLMKQLEKFDFTLRFYEEAALVQSDLIIKNAALGYYAGEIEYIEFLENTRQGFDIKLGYLEALNDYNQVVIQLEYLSGTIKK